MAQSRKVKSSRKNRGVRDNIYYDRKRKKYYVRIWKDGREIRRLGGSSIEAAQIVLADVRRAAERERLDLPRKSTATLSDFAPQYMKWAKAHKRSWDRDQNSLKQLLPKLGHLRLTAINKLRVESYMEDRRHVVAGPTINREVACLRKLMSKAVDHGLLEANPLLGIKMFPESPARNPSLETGDEQVRLLEACRPWLRSMVLLAVGTGCRQGVLLNLRWRDVNLEEGYLVVPDSKNNDSRHVPLHPILVEDLRYRRGLPGGFIITLPSGGSPSRFTVTDAFKEAARKIGRPELRFHDLRHVFGTRFLAEGASLPEVAAVMGHKTLEMARRYSHVSPARLKSLISKMPVT